jgi:hypothetical protein
VMDQVLGADHDPQSDEGPADDPSSPMGRRRQLRRVEIRPSVVSAA